MYVQIPIRGGGQVAADQIALFRDLDPRLQTELATALRCFRLKRGERCFSPGDPADEFYIICEGRLKIFQNSPEGREQILYVYSDGDFVGGLNLLKEQSYLYSGEALEDMVVAALSKTTFLHYFYDNPLILRRILEKSLDRIRWAEALIFRLSAGSADAKVASVLLQLARDDGAETAQGIRLDLPMSREELGSYAGLTRETMTRKLTQFRENGWIDFSGSRSILILDQAALRHCSDN